MATIENVRSAVFDGLADPLGADGAEVLARFRALEPEQRELLREHAPDAYEALNSQGETGAKVTRAVEQVYPAIEHLDLYTRVAPGGRGFDIYDTTYESDMPADPGWLASGPARLAWTMSLAPISSRARALWRDHATTRVPGGPVPAGFQYALPAYEDGEIRVAVFGDFGTGRGPQHWIARQMLEWRPALAIHLGDIYYAGTENDVRLNMWKVLRDLHQACPVWMIPGDHERFTDGGKPLLDYIDGLRESSGDYAGAKGEQEGTYFSLSNEHFQLIGLDGNSYLWNRLPKDQPNAVGDYAPFRQRSWLQEVLDARPQVQNLIFSQAPPHSENRASKVFGRQVDAITRGKDVRGWFFGDIHHAAWWKATQEYPYTSVLCGHGGIPKNIVEKPNQDPAQFWEWKARYPHTWAMHPSTGPDEDASRARLATRGRNGWLQLVLSAPTADRPARATGQFVDWMGNLRTERFELARFEQP